MDKLARVTKHCPGSSMRLPLYPGRGIVHAGTEFNAESNILSEFVRQGAYIKFTCTGILDFVVFIGRYNGRNVALKHTHTHI